MRVAQLIDAFITALESELPEWKYIKTNRYFTRPISDGKVYFHVACIKRIADFDAVGDVAVEILSKRKRVCIVGAELGNLQGIGQQHFHVYDSQSAVSAAQNIHRVFLDIGSNFIARFSDPNNILFTLQKGGPEAMLISPILNSHPGAISDLEQYVAT